MDSQLSDEEIKKLLADRLDEIKLALYEEVSDIRESVAIGQPHLSSSIWKASRKQIP